MNALSTIQLAPLPDPAVRELAGHGMVRSFRKGAVVINEGEAGDSLYVILSGRERIFLTNDHGPEMTLDTRGPSNMVGEMSLDRGLRSASVMCTAACIFSIITARGDRRQPAFRFAGHC